MFISYRRIDGEELASEFYNQFIKRTEKVFRDVIDIKVGEDSQKVIEDYLINTDIVIFIDTPRSGESNWIKKELSIALLLNIPIVWVKIGPSKNRAKLEIKPADFPHFDYEDFSIENNGEISTLIDNIIHKSFCISRESAKYVFDWIYTLKDLALKSDIFIKTLDSKNMIFQVEIPRRNFRYYQKPLTHIIQCYSRQPKKEDCLKINTILEELGYINHPQYGSFYDTTIFLSPKTCTTVNNLSCSVVDSFDSYFHCLNTYLFPEKFIIPSKKGVIISGAFPGCEPEFQQYLIDAIYSIATCVFQHNGTIIFGAHPTFQHLIFDIGKLNRPNDFKDAIRMYISKYFVTNATIEELRNNASIIPTDIKNNSRAESLTLMRQQMISDENAIALICLGGKIKSDEKSGVDEEIEIARSIGLPVFLIGSVGGRSAEITQIYMKKGWNEKINNLSVEDNIELMTSTDYKLLVNKILNSLNF